MPDLVPFRRGRSLLSPARFDDFFGVLDEFFSPDARSRTWRDTFKLDVRENEKEYCLDAELPGYSKEDIRLEIANDRLRIAVKREDTIDETKGNFIHRERRFGSQERSVYLADMDDAGIQAKFKNGILHVTVPKKRNEDLSKTIEIE